MAMGGEKIPLLSHSIILKGIIMKLRNVLAAASLSLVLASIPAQAHAFGLQSLINWCDAVIFSSRDTGTDQPDPSAQNDG